MTHSYNKLVLMSLLPCSLVAKQNVVVISELDVLQRSSQGQAVLKQIDIEENKVLQKLDEYKAHVAANEKELEGFFEEYQKDQQRLQQLGNKASFEEITQHQGKVKVLQEAQSELQRLRLLFNQKVQDVKQHIDHHYQKVTHNFLKNICYKYRTTGQWDVVLSAENKTMVEYQAPTADKTSWLLKELAKEKDIRTKKYSTVSDVKKLFQDLGLVYLHANKIDEHSKKLINQRRADYIDQNKQMLDIYTKKYSKDVAQSVRAPMTIKWVSDKVGWGVFADQDIVEGQFIQEYTGVSVSIVQGLDTTYAWNFLMMQEYPDRLAIDSIFEGNEMRFVNHSNHPNILCITMLGLDGNFHVCYVARAFIKAGEQLFVSYGAGYFVGRYYEDMVS
ncbi:SET domain-containing protein-lysine N-methyltransferase [Candidatus Babeliales bacterium]|nr:SET domain-containing protein-lysine N-methyltransferase [Candidatus Babeliales bacterium]